MLILYCLGLIILFVIDGALNLRIIKFKHEIVTLADELLVERDKLN